MAKEVKTISHHRIGLSTTKTKVYNRFERLAVRAFYLTIQIVKIEFVHATV